MESTAEWVILDTETDGLGRPIHVVEVAAQRMRGENPDGPPFRVFLNHKVPISAGAFALHGYTREFLARNGIAPGRAYEQLRAYVETRPVVAHPLQFDWNAVLNPEWVRLGIPTIGRRGFCSLMLARRALPEVRSHSLDSLREEFALDATGAHSAIGDIRTVQAILSRLVFPRLKRAGLEDFSEITSFSVATPLSRCHCVIAGRDFEAERRAKRKSQKGREKIVQEKQPTNPSRGPAVPGFGGPRAPMISRPAAAVKPGVTYGRMLGGLFVRVSMSGSTAPHPVSPAKRDPGHGQAVLDALFWALVVWPAIGAMVVAAGWVVWQIAARW